MTIADFFSTFFDDFNFSIFPKKAIGSDASEKPFGSSRGVREGIWGRPGGVREASVGVLGVSGGGLGRSWGDLGATF